MEEAQDLVEAIARANEAAEDGDHEVAVRYLVYLRDATDLALERQAAKAAAKAAYLAC